MYSWIEINSEGVNHIETYPISKNTQIYMREKTDFWVDVLYAAAEYAEEAELFIYDQNGNEIDIEQEICRFDISVDDIERRTWS